MEPTLEPPKYSEIDPQKFMNVDVEKDENEILEKNFDIVKNSLEQNEEESPLKIFSENVFFFL